MMIFRKPFWSSLQFLRPAFCGISISNYLSIGGILITLCILSMHLFTIFTQKSFFPIPCQSRSAFSGFIVFFNSFLTIMVSRNCRRISSFINYLSGYGIGSFSIKSVVFIRTFFAPERKAAFIASIFTKFNQFFLFSTFSTRFHVLETISLKGEFK